jgi:hypothetical protein
MYAMRKTAFFCLLPAGSQSLRILVANWVFYLLPLATPPPGRDQSGPYPSGHRCARLAQTFRHQYP